MIKINKLQGENWNCNCYIIQNKIDAIIIDPGANYDLIVNNFNIGSGQFGLVDNQMTALNMASQPTTQICQGKSLYILHSGSIIKEGCFLFFLDKLHFSELLRRHNLQLSPYHGCQIDHSV